MSAPVNRRGRPLLGAVSGLVWGLGATVLIQQYGMWPLNAWLVFGAPFVAAILSATVARWRGGRRVALAALLLLDPTSAAAQRGDCRLRLEFRPGGQRAVLQESSPRDPIMIEVDRIEEMSVGITMAGPESFMGKSAELWIEVGPVRIDLLREGDERLAEDGLRWEMSGEEMREALAGLPGFGDEVLPGIYHVGGQVEGVCPEDDGYIRLAGNPLENPIGQAAAAAVIVGLAGTWFASRPGLRHRPEESKDTGRPTVVRLPGHTIQARIYDEGGRPVTGFLAGTTHRIEVRYGPPGAPWPRESSGEIAGAVGPVRLTVVLTEHRLLDAPRVVSTALGDSGASGVCEFTLTTRPDTVRVDARLVALSGNRVLQTARLPREVVPAGGPPTDLPPEPGNVASVETVVRDSTEGLANRPQFAAAFVVNHNEEGRSLATGIADDQAMLIDLGEASIAEAVEKIRHRLGQVVTKPEVSVGLEAEDTRRLLVFLAHHGRAMRNALVKDYLGPALAANPYLQVVSARPDAYFPFEFSYDFPAPSEKAALCPSARVALDGPGFSATCSGSHDESVVCPFGFWGISKVIERHAFQPAGRPPYGYLVRGHPTLSRDRIPLSGGILLAASDRVDAHAAGSIARLGNALAGTTGGRLDRVDSWERWTAEVGARRPAVLLLLPHTVYSDALESYGLEIGAADRRWVADIDERLVPPEDRPVVVVLLGCETAAVGKIDYERFPGLFRQAGAEIVVATLTEILGRHAAPVAQRLMELLYTAREGGRGFGELMVELRRHYLAEGVPMALVLIAFGDADWILTGSAGESPSSGRGGHTGDSSDGRLRQ